MSDRIDPITKTINVNCSPATAFKIFTEQMTSWWPLDSNTVSAMDGGTAKSVTMEPKVGGAIFETKANGEREEWGQVIEYVADQRLVLAWRVMSPADKATNVEVNFSSNGDGTRVELIHTGWEVLEDGGQSARDSYNNGWVNVFEVQFGGACNAS